MIEGSRQVVGRIYIGTSGRGIFNGDLTQRAAWRLGYFASYLPNGSAADTADPDLDGVENLVEYATNRHPLQAIGAPSPTTLGQSVGNVLTLSFQRVADPTLTYTVEGLDALDGAPEDVWSSTGAANVAGGVTVPDNVVIGSQTERYLRLRVE